MSTNDNLSSLENQLHHIIDDVMDTVAAFDGRFSFTRTNPAGLARMTFHDARCSQSLFIQANIENETNARICVHLSNDISDKWTSIYDQPLKQTSIHHILGQFIASWYSQSIKAFDERPSSVDD